MEDGRKIWKLSDMDLKSYERWYDYSRARDAMFKATDTPWRRGSSHQFRRQEARAPEYHPAHPRQHPALRGVSRATSQKLPKRDKDPDYVEPDYPFKMVPLKY